MEDSREIKLYKVYYRYADGEVCNSTLYATSPEQAKYIMAAQLTEFKEVLILKAEAANDTSK
jgi:hypothetical protein